MCKILVGYSTDLRTAELNFRWAGCVSESEGSEKVSGLDWPNIKHIDPETDTEPPNKMFILVLISAEILKKTKQKTSGQSVQDKKRFWVKCMMAETIALQAENKFL